MRVVVDTSIFVSACLGSVVCGGVLRACFRAQALPLMGTALLTEYEAVLARGEIFARCRLSASDREELLDAFLAQCAWVRIFYGWRPNLPDEGDNHLIELAVAGAADAIVTRNLRDLMRAELLFPGLAILNPEDFLTRLP